MAFSCKDIFFFMLLIIVVMAHIEFWFLGLKFSAKDIEDSGAHPSSFGMGHKGEIVRLDITQTCRTRDSKQRESEGEW